MSGGVKCVQRDRLDECRPSQCLAPLPQSVAWSAKEQLLKPIRHFVRADVV